MLSESRLGNTLIILTGTSGLLITAVCIPFVLPACRRICLPYVPATKQQVHNIFKGLNGRHGSLIDLGSGDGRIVIEAAKLNFSPAVGVELNMALLWYSRLRALTLSVNKKVRFLRNDLWRTQLKTYDNIVLFGVEQMMIEIEEKFRNECQSDCILAICRFPLPTMEPSFQVGSGIDTVWFYKSPNKHYPRTTNTS